MADIKPNPLMERQKVVRDIAKLQATIETQRVEQYEMEERRKKNDENITRSLETIVDYEQKLAEFDQDK